MDASELNHLLHERVILVVDDEEDSLEIAQTLLEISGATVITATNGREGLQLAQTHKPLFIISDLSMPEMSGWEMLHALKADAHTSEIPVVALTAHAMVGDRNRAIAAGFHNYLTKPLMPETFVRDLLRVVLDTPSIARLVE